MAFKGASFTLAAGHGSGGLCAGEANPSFDNVLTVFFDALTVFFSPKGWSRSGSRDQRSDTLAPPRLAFGRPPKSHTPTPMENP